VSRCEQQDRTERDQMRPVQLAAVSARRLQVRADQRLRGEYRERQRREPQPGRIRAARSAERSRQMDEREAERRVTGNRVRAHPQSEAPACEAPQHPAGERRRRNERKREPAGRRSPIGRHSTLT
jgi:hypothetical protein